MRCVNWLALLILNFAPLSFAQNGQKDQQTAPSPGTAPSAQDPSHPQEQAPPALRPPAPNGDAQSNSTSGSHSLPSGAEILAALDTPLSTRTAQVGDRFTATVAAPIKDASGNIVVAPGAKLNGQVSGD